MGTRKTRTRDRYVGSELGRFVGLRVRDLRKRRGASQDELAAWIGVSQAVISHYEHDLRDIPARTLLAALHVFDCPPEEFFSGAPELIVLLGRDAELAAQVRDDLALS